VERAELLCDSGGKNRRSWMMLSVFIGVIVPMISVLPFTLALEGDGEDPSRDGLIVSSVWSGCILGYVKICFVCTLIFPCLITHCFFIVLQYYCGTYTTHNEPCICKNPIRRAYSVCLCGYIC
jgi:hypothetical protein